MPEAIFNTSVYFKNVYEDCWITDPFTKAMIQDIDQSTVLGSAVIDSPVLGKISPISLSGGVKTLILMKNEPQTIFIIFLNHIDESRFSRSAITADDRKISADCKVVSNTLVLYRNSVRSYHI